MVSSGRLHGACSRFHDYRTNLLFCLSHDTRSLKLCFFSGCLHDLLCLIPGICHNPVILCPRLFLRFCDGCRFLLLNLCLKLNTFILFCLCLVLKLLRLLIL